MVILIILSFKLSQIQSLQITKPKKPKLLVFPELLPMSSPSQTISSSSSSSSFSSSFPLTTSQLLALDHAFADLQFLKNFGPALYMTPNSQFIFASNWEKTYRNLFPDSESRFEELNAGFIIFPNISMCLVSKENEENVLENYRKLQCEAYKSYPKRHEFVPVLQTKEKEYYYKCIRANWIGADLLDQFGIKFDPNSKYQPICEIKLFTNDQDSSNPSYRFIPDPSKKIMPKLESNSDSFPSESIKMENFNATSFERKVAEKKLKKITEPKQFKQSSLKSLAIQNKKSKN